MGHGGADGGRWWACSDVALVMVPMVFASVAGVAFITVERSLAVMAEHVGFQLVRVAELLLAHLAFVGFFAGVHSEVPPQVGDLDELSIAVGARVGLFTGVKSHVGLEVVIPGESLVAFRAFEGLFTGVGSLVVLENMLVAKRAIADLAGEDLVPRGIPSGGSNGLRKVDASVGLWRGA